MLSKVNQSNKFMGTEMIKNYLGEYYLIQDNLFNMLLIKKKNNSLDIDNYIIYDYNKKKFYKYNRLPIYFNDNIIYKQIESFDQNNIIIANKIRKYVLQEVKIIFNNKLFENILGIGGEYYLYFKFLVSNKYFGISNHKCIIEDAKYNIPNSENYLINYDKYDTFPNLYKIDLVIINVTKIHENIIKYIKLIQSNNIIIITCKLTNNKLILLKQNFKIKKIKYFKNLNSLIRIIQI